MNEAPAPDDSEDFDFYPVITALRRANVAGVAIAILFCAGIALAYDWKLVAISAGVWFLVGVLGLHWLAVGALILLAVLDVITLGQLLVLACIPVLWPLLKNYLQHVQLIESIGGPSGLADESEAAYRPLGATQSAKLMAKTTLVLATFVAVLGLTVWTLSVPVPDKIAAWNDLRHADSASRSGESTRALASYKNVIRSEPESSRAYLGLTCNLWEAGYADQAVAFLQTAIETEVRAQWPPLPKDCFANAMEDNGWSRVIIGGKPFYLTVLRESSRDLALWKVLTELAVNPASEPEARVMVACLNDLNGYTVSATMQLTRSFISALMRDEFVDKTKIPKACDNVWSDYKIVRGARSPVVVHKKSKAKVYPVLEAQR